MANEIAFSQQQPHALVTERPFYNSEGSTMTELRRVPRFPLVAPVEILEMRTGTHMMAQVSELNLFGCYIDTLNPLPPRTNVQLRITRDGETFTTIGIVAFSTPGMGMGIQFTSVEHNQQTILREWLDRFAVICL